MSETMTGLLLKEQIGRHDLSKLSEQERETILRQAKKAMELAPLAGMDAAISIVALSETEGG